MLKNLQKIFTLIAMLIAIKASAQNQVYWREGFEPASTPACDLTTTNPTSIVPAPTSDVSYYFNGVGGKWWGKNLYRTTGTNCGNGTNHVRFRNMGTTGFDSGALVTPIVTAGIQELHFLRARASRTYTIWTTSDTSATTTNWVNPISMKGWANPTCQDTTIVVASATAKRLKIVTRAGLDVDIDSLFITSFSQILPVKFGAFSASSNAGFSLLKWNIESEINTSSYQVQRSINGKEFSIVGTILANKQNAYSFVDETNNNSIAYYRITALDKDGKTTTSNVVKVSNEKNIKTTLSVFPNPVINSRLNIQLNNIAKGSYKANMYNLNGVLVGTQNINSDGNNMAQTIDLPSALSKGTYTLEITNGNYRITQTILFQ